MLSGRNPLLSCTHFRSAMRPRDRSVLPRLEGVACRQSGHHKQRNKASGRQLPEFIVCFASFLYLVPSAVWFSARVGRVTTKKATENKASAVQRREHDGACQITCRDGFTAVY